MTFKKIGSIITQSKESKRSNKREYYYLKGNTLPKNIMNKTLLIILLKGN